MTNNTDIYSVASRMSADELVQMFKSQLKTAEIQIPREPKVELLPRIYQMFHKKTPIEYIEELASENFIIKLIEEQKAVLEAKLFQLEREKERLAKEIELYIQRGDLESAKNAYIRMQEILYEIRIITDHLEFLKTKEAKAESISKVFKQYLLIWKSMPHNVKLGFFTEEEIYMLRRLLTNAVEAIALSIIFNIPDLFEFVVNVIFPEIDSIISTSLARGGFFLKMIMASQWQPIEIPVREGPSFEQLVGYFASAYLKKEEGEKQQPQQQQ